MPNPKLDILLLNLAAELGDNISTPTEDGETYSFEKRLKAINMARGTVYSDMLKAFNSDFDKFLKLYPEFVDYRNIIFTSLFAKKAADIRYIIKGNVGSTVFEPLKAKVLIEALTDSNSSFYADANYPKFFEYKDNIKLFGITTSPITISMVCVLQPVDVEYTTYLGVAATGVLTASDNPSNNTTVTIGDIGYTFKTALSSPSVANEVLIGINKSTTLNNLKAAINKEAGEGTLYGTGTTAHALVTSTASEHGIMNIAAKSVGEAGNEIITATTSEDLSWGAAKMSGGIEPYANDIIEPYIWKDLIVLAAKNYILRNLQE